MQINTLLKEVLDGLNLQLVVYAVTASPNGGWVLSVDQTHYLNTNKQFKISGIVYTVTSFIQDKQVTVTGSIAPVRGSYTLPPPYFTHGKLKAVNFDLAKKEPLITSPLIWNFEIQGRTRPAEVDTVIISEGAVKLFFMTTANYEDFDTDAHYTECIEPMNTVIDSFIKALKDHRRTGLVFENSRTAHAKFTTGGNSTTAGTEKNVLPVFVSGIELDIAVPIIEDYTCKIRKIPITDGSGFSKTGFNEGFDNLK